MKKLLALVLAMACALSLGIPTLAKTADYTWNQVNVEDFVDEDGDKIADDDVIRPGQTIYWVFGKYSDYDYLLDDKMVKIDVDKDEGSKNIDGKPKVVGKKLGNLGRCVALEIVIKDTYTADELKTKLDIYITAKKDLIADNAGTIVNGNYEFPQFKPGTPGSTGGDVTALKKAVEDAQKKVNDLKADKTALEKEIANLQNQLATEEAKIQGVKDAYETTTHSVVWTGGSENVTYKAIVEDAADGTNGTAALATKARTAANDNDQKISAAQATIAEQENIIAAAKAAIGASVTINTADTGNSDTPADFTITVDWNNLATAWKVTGGSIIGDKTVIDCGIDGINEQAVIDAMNAKPYNNGTGAYTALTGAEAAKGTAETELTEAQNKKSGLDQEAQKAESKRDAYAALLTAAQEAKRVYEAASTGTIDTIKGNISTAQGKLDVINSVDDTTEGSLAKANKELTTAQNNLKNNAGSVGGLGYLKKGETMKVPMTIWIQNENRVDDDATFVAGEKGVVIKPVKNEENTVTWEDNNDTLAIMKFTADSDVEYYMPRMATKWNNEDYLDYFDDMDAYIRSFVGNPSIPCTSRARLWINNPFVDDDGEETIDPDDIYVYEVVDGELYDITDKVEYTTNDDDDYAFLIKTRTLGTYIFSDGPADIEDEDDDDYDPEAPDKVEVNNNKKPVPPTGF